MTLPQVMLVAYLAALVYGTLYPWKDWHWVGWAAFGFVDAPWPRWWTGFDVALNVASYLPLGALIVLAAAPRRAGWPAVALAIAAGCALSFALEALQSHLPQRVPSRLDWFANTAGAALGAALAAAAREHAWSRLNSWAGRHAAGAGPARVDALGVTLVVTWALLPMHPRRPLFASADLGEMMTTLADLALRLLGDHVAAPERLRHLGDALRLDPGFTVLAEAGVVATAVVALGMIVREMFPPGWPRPSITAAIVGAAALVETCADALLPGSRQPFAWLTAGAQGGLLLGTVLLALLAAAWRRTRLVIATVAIAVNVALTTAFPPDSFHPWLMGAGLEGAWRNFDGMMRGLTLAWPFAACAWCLLRLRRARRLERA